ncbi:multidrug efflux RND transporter permease subunit [Sulfuricurvum sp. IAE1]|uniref:efflux RND transporter permease subunit n=1 Tax=Sulfuricurvum sp. IAE1 TaxID=2546102 RepID=UPI0010526609|nr:multidrug efflux RND transporter permease subunit [Sulfuricurvum sp. IAE1]TDA62501.1 multidrug efflux RND transporter permease subunit [Sulfuricurvum sp. IAE1]
MFSRFFIDRPIFSTVIAVIITFAGVIGLYNLPVQEYPSVAPPQISVEASYPGADAETLAKTVARPLEDSINGVENMLYMSSTTSSSGTVNIAVTFATGTDPSQASVDVNNRVQVALAKLPEEARRMGISVHEQSPSMLRVIGFTSNGAVHNEIWLNNYAINHVIDEIKRIKGVGNAMMFGSKEYAIRVWLQPDKMAAFNLSPTDISKALQTQNIQMGAGQIGAEPTAIKQTFTYTVTTPGRLKTVDDFNNILIRTDPDGSSLLLKDVARVELGAENYMLKGTYNKHDMAVAGVFLSPGANSLEVSAQLDKVLLKASEKFPKDLRYHNLFDTTKFVKTSIHEVLLTLVEAIIMVILIIYIFLGNWRATLIPVLAIPVSIIGTFVGLYLVGFSINLLTLFALILSIGLVVDDAIVVIENVERILRSNDKLSVREATVIAMKEISGPIIAIVLVLSAVFIPASLSGGFSGVMYQQFAMTIMISVAISGFIALTLTPALCPVFLRKEESEPILPIRLFNQFFERSTLRFSNGVRNMIRYITLNLFIFATLVATGMWMTQKIPTSLLPEEDKGIVLLMSYLMPGSSLERTIEVQNQVSETVMSHQQIEGIGSISGLDMGTFAFQTDAGIAFANLKDWSYRPDETESAKAVAGQLTEQLQQNKEAMIIAVNPPPIDGMSNTGGFELYVEDRTGGDIQKLNDYVNEIVAEALKRPELSMATPMMNTEVPQYHITIDKEKAKALGIDESDIYETLGMTFGSNYINDYNLFGRVYHVNMQLEHGFRDEIDDYSDVYVRSLQGNMVPISSLIHVERIVGPNVIQRFNMFNAGLISVQPAPKYSSSEAMSAIEDIAAQVLPSGYTIEWTGTAYQEKLLQKKGNYTFIYAVIFIFLILAALYESWSIPFAVLMTVPFALFGAALGVYLRGLENDIYFQIGLITLVGLTAKNAILVVEFAQQKLREGYSLYDSTIEGATIRLRPIIMTSLAFIGGTIPLAISTGAGSNSRHIIGTTVVSGMTVLTLIAIFFIPLFYYLIMKFKMKLSQKKVDYED